MRIEDAPYIPIHPLCRCVYIPISKFWEELEIDPQTERASMFGQTTGNYPDWLTKQETKKPGFGKNILGKNYQNWLDGKYNLDEKVKQFIPQSTVADFIEREKLKARESRKKLELKKKEDLKKKETLRKKLAKEALKKKIEQWNTFQDLQTLGMLVAGEELLDDNDDDDDDDDDEIEVDDIVGSENNSWGSWNEKNIPKNEKEKLTRIENYYKKHKKLPKTLENKIELAKLKNKYWVKKGDHEVVIVKKYKIKKIIAKVIKYKKVEKKEGEKV